MRFKTHLTDYLRANAEKSAAKLALVTDDRSLTWAQLWQEVQAGAQFVNSRLPAGRRGSPQIIALLLPNSWQSVVAYLSVVHAGHMALPIDVIFKPLEIEAVLRQVPPQLVITDRQGRPRIKNCAVPIIDVADFPVLAPKKEIAYLRQPATEQVACLLFTSGTTGQPKVVPNTHANHIWNITACSKVWNWTSEDSQLVCLRLSHMHGLVMGLSGTLYHGNTMYLEDRFSAEKTLEILASRKVSIFSNGPLVFMKLLEAVAHKSYDLSGVRLFISGSGPMPPTIWQDFKDVFGAEILEVYGTTETGRIASNLLDERISGSPGRPLPGVDLRFSDEGEVLVKSPGVFPGYWQNSSQTKSQSEPDGFWHTGDLGELRDGRVVLKGRMAERIRRQGYTISPRDVEWALYTNPAIKDVTVVGFQTPGQPNDRLVYFMSTNLSEDEIKDFCKTALPSVWRPDKIVIMDKLPRTRSAKVNIPALRAMI